MDAACGVGIYISRLNKVGNAVVLVVFSCQGADLLSVLLDLADDMFWTSPLEIFTNLHISRSDGILVMRVPNIGMRNFRGHTAQSYASC
jgi:hypothetical protein